MALSAMARFGEEIFMVLKKLRFLALLLPLSLVLVATACEPIATLIKPAKTETPLPANPTLAHTATITATSTPNPTKTNTPAPTETALPDWDQMAIGNNEVVEKLNHLPGCQLPCWWGITPGKTSWEEAEVILADLNAKISFNPKINDEQRVFIYVPVLLEGTTVRLLDNQMMIKSGVILQIETDECLGDFSCAIAPFLVENGKPDEIWIHSFASNMGGPPPFDVWFFYWEKGIAAEFFRSEKSAKYGFDGLIHACIERGPILYLWSDHINTLPELAKKISRNFSEPYYPVLSVEQAIGLSVDEFYNKYKDSTELPCFVTEPGLWPEP